MKRLLIILSILSLSTVGADENTVNTSVDTTLLTGKTWECLSQMNSDRQSVTLKTEDIYYDNGTFESAGEMSITLNGQNEMRFSNPVSGTWSVEDKTLVITITQYSLQSIDGSENSKLYEINSTETREDNTTITELKEEYFATENSPLRQECRAVIAQVVAEDIAQSSNDTIEETVQSDNESVEEITLGDNTTTQGDNENIEENATIVEIGNETVQYNSVIALIAEEITQETNESVETNVAVVENDTVVVEKNATVQNDEITLDDIIDETAIKAAIPTPLKAVVADTLTIESDSENIEIGITVESDETLEISNDSVEDNLTIENNEMIEDNTTSVENNEILESANETIEENVTLETSDETIENAAISTITAPIESVVFDADILTSGAWKCSFKEENDDTYLNMQSTNVYNKNGTSRVEGTMRMKLDPTLPEAVYSIAYDENWEIFDGHFKTELKNVKIKTLTKLTAKAMTSSFTDVVNLENIFKNGAIDEMEIVEFNDKVFTVQDLAIYGEEGKTIYRCVR